MSIGYILAASSSASAAKDSVPVAGLIGLIIITVLGLAAAAGILWLYFLPSVIASKNKHPMAPRIFLINLFFGWTIITWIWMLIIALTPLRVVAPPPSQSSTDELAKWADLLAKGAISQEEYDAKKKQLLKL